MHDGVYKRTVLSGIHPPNGFQHSAKCSRAMCQHFPRALDDLFSFDLEASTSFFKKRKHTVQTSAAALPSACSRGKAVVNNSGMTEIGARLQRVSLPPSSQSFSPTYHCFQRACGDASEATVKCKWLSWPT